MRDHSSTPKFFTVNHCDKTIPCVNCNPSAHLSLGNLMLIQIEILENFFSSNDNGPEIDFSPPTH